MQGVLGFGFRAFFSFIIAAHAGLHVPTINLSWSLPLFRPLLYPFRIPFPVRGAALCYHFASKTCGNGFMRIVSQSS